LLPGGHKEVRVEKIWLPFYERGVPPTITLTEDTLNDVMARSAKTYADHTATNFVLKYLLGGRFTVGGRLTYRQLSEMIDRMATALYQLGVRKGDRVALMLPNSPHYVISFFAAMRLGAIVVNINPTYTSRELQHQLVDSGAETIVMLNLFFPRLREVKADTPVKRTIVAHVFDTLGFPSSLLVKSQQKKAADWVDVKPEQDIFFFAHLLEKYQPTPPRVEVSPDETALFQYTGGTTGLPKAAMLSHRNLVANVMQLGAWFVSGQPGGEKMMAAIPFFHVYGMTVAMIYSIHIGAEIVIVPNPRPIENVMTIIQKERCTLYPGVPAMYIGVINHPRVNEFDLRSLKACFSGSAPLPMDVQERFGQLTGARLIEAFGMTESSPVTHANPIFGERRAGSIGIPVSNTEAKIIDLESGAEIAPGSDQTGELCVRGPQIMQGYYNRPEETAQTVDADGWLHTGDIARVDRDGYFYIVDRKKDMINASGFKVLPRDVEEVLFMHPKVMEAVVVGVPNPARGDDTVKAFVVARDGEKPTADEIREFCKLHLAPYKVPREVEFRSELPKTLVGKVLRRVLVEEEKAKQAAR
jgi:long-chain acyl-CoA synthetase